MALVPNPPSLTMSKIFALKSVNSRYDLKTRTWFGPRIPPLYHPNISLGQIALNHLSANPFDIAQICCEDGHVLKNWVLARDSVRVALHFKELNLTEGDVIGFAASNSRHVAALAFGSLLVGSALGTLDPAYEIDELVHVIKSTRPKIMICDKDNYCRVEKALTEVNSPCSIYVFDGESNNAIQWKSVEELLKEHPHEKDFV